MVAVWHRNRAQDALRLAYRPNGYEYEEGDEPLILRGNAQYTLTDLSMHSSGGGFRSQPVPFNPDVAISGYHRFSHHRVWVLGEAQICLMPEKASSSVKGGQAILRVSDFSRYSVEVSLLVRDKTLVHTKSVSQILIGMWILEVFKSYMSPSWSAKVDAYFSEELRSVPPDPFIREVRRLRVA